jgi:hypothetical protein
MNIQKKIQKINELLEVKNVIVQDDYFFDIFRCEKTNKEIFSAQSLNGNITKEREEQILDEVLSKLFSYENKT